MVFIGCVRSLPLDTTNKDKLARIDEAERIYEDIKSRYKAFIRSKEGKACIAAFDSAMPYYKEKLTEVKKIDFFLWSKTY